MERKSVDEARQILSGPPAGYFVVMPPQEVEDGSDLADFLRKLRSSWLLLLVGCVLGAACGAVVSLVLPEMYRARAIVANANQANSGALGALGGQFGGLAALAGIDLGSMGGKKEEGFATLSSPGFARDFMLAENVMPQLFAKDWDATAKAWKKDRKPPLMQEGVEDFMDKVRTIAEDRKTGMITVTVEWRSAEVAAHWANRMVEMVNERLRADAIRNSEQSIEYLNKELAKTQVVELRQAIFRIIEDQVKQSMLANVQREYAFRFIDRAIAPEKRFKPKRAVMTALGAFLGLIAAFAVVVIRYRFVREPARASKA